jgi:hypothetical protein
MTAPVRMLDLQEEPRDPQPIDRILGKLGPVWRHVPDSSSGLASTSPAAAPGRREAEVEVTLIASLKRIRDGAIDMRPQSKDLPATSSAGGASRTGRDPCRQACVWLTGG